MRALTIGPDGPGAPRAVLVPGNDLDGPFYAPLALALARRGVRTTLLTLPGWAGVPPLAEPGWGPLVRAVGGAAAEALGGGAGGGGGGGGAGGTLIGHSLGALVALLVAAAAPPGVRRLVLLEPIVLRPRALALRLARSYLARVVLGGGGFENGGPLFRRVHDLARFPPAAIARYEEVRRASDRASVRALFEGLPALYPLPLERVRVPALLVRGARSGLLPRIGQAWLARGLPAASRVVLPYAGHWIANEADEAAADAIATSCR